MKNFLIGALILAAVQAGAIAALWATGGTEAAGFLPLFAVGVCLLSFTRRFGLTGIFAILSGAFALAMWLRIHEFEQGTTVTLADVADAPRHPAASAFILLDARPRRALLGVHEKGSGRNHKYFSVAPVVGPRWTPAQPVPMWAHCLSNICEPDFDRVWRGALVSKTRNGGYHNAIAGAERQHGLTTAPGAPDVQLVDDPAEEVEFFRRFQILSLALGHVAWAVASIVLARRRPPVRA